MAALLDLEAAYEQIRDGARVLGGAARARPPLRRPADARSTAPTGWPRELERRAGRAPGRLRLYLKREDLDHTGAHKINNALGQALLTRRLGKQRVIAETGAGQHGVATATACALLDLECVVYMGAEDIRRQAPNVLRMRALGTEVREVTSGTRDAQGRDQRGDARLGHERRARPTTSWARRSGRIRIPALVRDLQRVIGDEAAEQVRDARGPAAGRRDRVRRRRLERDRPAQPVHRRAAGAAGGRRGGGGGARRPPRRGAGGRLAGRPARIALVPAPGRRRAGDRRRTRSRPGWTTRASGPQLSALFDGGPAGDPVSATDDEALEGVRLLTRTEGILPALEPAHAIAALGAWLAGQTALDAARRRRDRAARPVGPRRQGPRGDRRPARAMPRGVAAGRRTPMRPAARPDRPGASHAAQRGWPGGAHPIRRGGLPGRRRLGRGRDRADRCAARTCSRSACPTRDPLADGATLQRASRVALRSGRDARSSRSTLVGRVRGRAPGHPARGDGLRQPGHGRPRRRLGPAAPGRGRRLRASSSPT